MGSESFYLWWMLLLNAQTGDVVMKFSGDVEVANFCQNFVIPKLLALFAYRPDAYRMKRNICGIASEIGLSFSDPFY